MKTVSYNTPLIDADAILTTFAVTEDDQELDDTDLDGVIGADLMSPERTLTLATAAATDGYVADSTIVIEGLDRDGLAVSETFTLTDVDGGETFVGTQRFALVTGITVDAQEVDTTGSFIVGVRDIVLDPRALPSVIRAGGAGDFHLAYGDMEDTIETVLANTQLNTEPTIIYGDSTATKITLFF